MIFGKNRLINELKKDLAEKESQLKASTDLMKDAQNELIQFQKKTAAAKSELKSELEKKEAELKELKESNGILQSAADKAKKAETDLKSRLDSAESALSEAKVRADAAGSGSSTLLEKIKSLEDSLKSKDKEIASLGDSLKSKDKEIASLGDSLKSMEKLVSEKESLLQEAKKKIGSLSDAAAASRAEPEVYNVRFIADGRVIAETRMSSEEDAVNIPPVPEKEDCIGEWQYEKEGSNVTVTAVYSPIIYDLVFFVDDAKYCEMKASLDDAIEVPPVPAKEDYAGEWVYTIIDGSEVRIDALYRPIEYDAEFYSDGRLIAERKLSAESCSDIPAVPEKEDFEGEWVYDITEDGKVIVYADYAPKVYDLMFFADNEMIGQMKVAVGESITLPAVPEKEDYTGEWAYTVIDGNTARIDALYLPKIYDAEFYADGRKIADMKLSADSQVSIPEVPSKEDYDGEWQYETVSDGKVRVDAVYRPVVYDLVFFVDDAKYCEMKASPSERIVLPEVPPKDGCSGEWIYTVVDGTSARIDAYYTPLDEEDAFGSVPEEGAEGILLTFYADGKVCGRKLITSEEEIQNVPPVPAKEDYEGRWEYEQTGEDTADMIAVYTPIEYQMMFYVDGEKYAEAVMTAEDGESVVPEVPAKPGYTGEWQYKKDGDRVVVTAVYTAE